MRGCVRTPLVWQTSAFGLSATVSFCWVGRVIWQTAALDLLLIILLTACIVNSADATFASSPLQVVQKLDAVN